MALVAAVVVAVAHRENPLAAVALGVLVVIAGWLSAIDLKEHRLPNRIVGPLAGAVLLAVVSAGIWNADLARSGRALLFGLGAAAVLLVGNLVGGIGMGDVKYAFPLWATLGWFGADAVVMAALVTAAAGGLAAIVVLLSGRGRQYRLPYGPFMSIGLVAGLLQAATNL